MDVLQQLMHQGKLGRSLLLRRARRYCCCSSNEKNPVVSPSLCYDGSCRRWPCLKLGRRSCRETRQCCTFKKASMSPTAGMKSGMKGCRLCSSSTVCGVYLGEGRGAHPPRVRGRERRFLPQRKILACPPLTS